VTAAARAQHGTTATAAPLLTLWGAGSFAGGLLVTRFTRARGTASGLTRWLAALAVAHLALTSVAGSVGALAIALPLAGVTIAPTESAVYAMVEAAAPTGALTEAFSWLVTAIELGAALGAAGGGAFVDRLGPAAAFGLGAGACALAALITALHAPRLAVGRLTPHLDAPSRAK
jgi:predicted MFS family arabinose efflux permease